jgi:hypothetical protein
MAQPTLTPTNTTSTVILPVTGAHTNVLSALPYGIYKTDAFISGAVDQVAFTYKKLGGDVLDVELTEGNVYSSYEEAVLEYSYLINIHQAKNSLGDLLGHTTASFDQDGQIVGGHALSGSNIELRYPRFSYEYSKRVSLGLADMAGVNGALTQFSASFSMIGMQQDYDLQTIISSSIEAGNIGGGITSAQLNNNRIDIVKVYYKTQRAMWRFFTYYGGLNVVGNLTTYGQYADDSTFEIVPTWQNKAQAMAYEDSLYTRVSHWSYEIFNNKIRIYPIPDGVYPLKLWIRFKVIKEPWEEYADRKIQIEGINNMNTLPYGNIKYNSINSIGKQWIRRFALALSKETLGQIRGKLSSIPIPGDNITLNAGELLSQAKSEQDSLRDELKTILDELTYAKLAEKDAAVADNVSKLHLNIGYPIYVG